MARLLPSPSTFTPEHLKLPKPWENDEVLWVSFPLECILTLKGWAFPVTNWYDEYANETTKDNAVYCVAGWEGMCWWTVQLARFRRYH